MLRIFAITTALLSPALLQAQEFVLGVGQTDYNQAGIDGVALSLDYRHKPFREGRVASYAFGVAAEITEEGDFFVGAGLSTRWQWDSGWFIDTSIMPGFYDEGVATNDLGSDLQFRSVIGLGYQFNNGHSVSAALTHKSNADLADTNPGMNSYSIRYHFPF